jgi:WD40 repeat protein
MSFQLRSHHFAAIVLLLGTTSLSFAQEGATPKHVLEHGDEVTSIAFSPDGLFLASSSLHEAVRLWDMNSGKRKAVLKNTLDLGCAHVAYSRDCKTLAVGGSGNKVAIVNIESGDARVLLDARAHSFSNPQVVFSADGKKLASGGECQDDIWLWDTISRKEIGKLERDDPYGYQAIAFQPDGKSLVSIGSDGALREWDLESKKERRTEKLAERATTAAFSEGQKTAAVASWEEIDGDARTSRYFIQLHDVASARKVFSLEGHKNHMWALAFSRDGKKLASGDYGGVVKLWDVATGKETISLDAHKGPVRGLAFSPDGSTLASCGEDGTIKVWDVRK